MPKAENFFLPELYFKGFQIRLANKRSSHILERIGNTEAILLTRFLCEDHKQQWTMKCSPFLPHAPLEFLAAGLPDQQQTQTHH